MPSERVVSVGSGGRWVRSGGECLVVSLMQSIKNAQNVQVMGALCMVGAVCVVCVQLCGATLTPSPGCRRASGLSALSPPSGMRARSGPRQAVQEKEKRRKEKGARSGLAPLTFSCTVLASSFRQKCARSLCVTCSRQRPANRPTRARQQHATQQSVWLAVCHAQGAQGAQAAGGTCPNQAVLYVRGPRHLARSSAAICNPPTALVHPARSRPPTHIHTHTPARPLARPRTPPLPSAHPPCSS